MVDCVLRLWLVLMFAVAVSCCRYTSCAQAGNSFLSEKQALWLVTEHDRIKLSVDIADTEEARTKGLMGTKTLPPNYGMLFVFDDNRQHTFWMKNTHPSLDIIFFDEHLNVVGIVENTTPLSLRVIDIKKESRYALELAAGSAKKYGINLNTRASLSP